MQQNVLEVFVADICYTDFYSAVSDFLTKDEAQKVFDDLQNRAKIKQQSEKLSQAQALYESVLDTQTALDHQANLDKYRTMLNYFKLQEINAYVGRYSNPLDGIKGTLIGNYADIDESLSYSTELAQATERASVINAFSMDMKADPAVWDTFTDRLQSVDIANELYGIETGNLNAKRAAAIYRDHLERTRLRQNEFGADIGNLQEYIARQSHSPEKLLQTDGTWRERNATRIRAFRRNRSNYGLTNEELQNKAFQRWSNFIMPLLDYKKTFANVADEDVQNFLRGAWEGLTTGRHFSPEEFDTPLDFNNKPKTFKNYAAKFSAARKIHFKDGTSWEKYSQEYGTGSVPEAMVSTLRRSANNIAMLSKWGPNPRRMFDIVLNQSVDKASRLDFVKKSKINKTSARLQAYFDMLDGTAYIPVDFMGAKTGQSLRSWQFLSKVGMMVFSSLGDIAPRAELMRTIGTNPLSAYFESISSMIQGRPADEARMIADATGVWADSTMGHMAAYMADSTHMGGMVSKSLMMFNKLTLQEWWDETSRLGIGSYLARCMALMKDTPFKDLPANQRTMLRMYGLSNKEWDLMRANENTYRVEKGKQFITPDAVWGYSDKSIATYLDKAESELTPREITGVKREMNHRLMSFFIDKTNDANLRPGIESRYTIIRGTRPGTWAGEGLRMIGQFKYYSIEFGRRILGRKIFGVRQDRGYGLVSGSPDISGLINVILGSTILGYVSMQSKNILKNRTLRSPTDLGTWTASLLQGGGLGLYGDFFFGQYNRFGQSMIESIAGPVPVSLEQGAVILLKMEHLEDPTNQISQFAKNNLPMLNLFYLRTSLDFLLLNGLQEEMSPGSLQRYNDKIQRDNDQQFIINPLILSPWAR